MYITIYQIIKILHFLYFRVRPEHVEQGIKLECTAAIGAVFWQSFQEKIPVIPRIEKSTSSSNWWRSSSGASSSSSFVQHVANIILGKQKIILKDYIKCCTFQSQTNFNLIFFQFGCWFSQLFFPSLYLRSSQTYLLEDWHELYKYWIENLNVLTLLFI